MFSKIQDHQGHAAFNHSSKHNLQTPAPAHIPEHMPSLSTNDVLYNTDTDKHKTVKSAPASSIYLHNINEEASVDQESISYISFSLQDNLTESPSQSSTQANSIDPNFQCPSSCKLTKLCAQFPGKPNLPHSTQPATSIPQPTQLIHPSSTQATCPQDANCFDDPDSFLGTKVQHKCEKACSQLPSGSNSDEEQARFTPTSPCDVGSQMHNHKFQEYSTSHHSAAPTSPCDVGSLVDSAPHNSAASTSPCDVESLVKTASTHSVSH